MEDALKIIIVDVGEDGLVQGVRGELDLLFVLDFLQMMMGFVLDMGSVLIKMFVNVKMIGWELIAVILLHALE